MRKEIKHQLKAYKVHTSEQQKINLIALGKEKIFKKHLQRHSYFNLFLSTFRFVRIKTWLLQFIILGLSIALIYTYSTQHVSFKNIINSYLIILIFSLLFFLDEVYRSFTSGMYELEKTFKYNLTQHVLMKLLIFGITDILIIFNISLLSNNILSTPLLKVIIYLLVPFNLLCISIFSILAEWKNKPTRLFLWIVTGVISSILFILVNITNIYEINIYYWITCLVLSSSLIIGMIYNQLKKVNKEVLWHETDY